jgi:hypothetical protein
MNSLWNGTLEQHQIAQQMANKKLYTTPQQRPWVGLKDEDKYKPDMGKYVYLNGDWRDGYKTGMEYAEAYLKEKNND